MNHNDYPSFGSLVKFHETTMCVGSEKGLKHLCKCVLELNHAAHKAFMSSWTSIWWCIGFEEYHPCGIFSNVGNLLTRGSHLNLHLDGPVGAASLHFHAECMRYRTLDTIECPVEKCPLSYLNKRIMWKVEGEAHMYRAILLETLFFMKKYRKAPFHSSTLLSISQGTEAKLLMRSPYLRKSRRSLEPWVDLSDFAFKTILWKWNYPNLSIDFLE